MDSSDPPTSRGSETTPTQPFCRYTLIRWRAYSGLDPVLDFAPMSYWRKLFLVVLLALSLPVQSFAAVSMVCAPSEGAGDESATRHLGQSGPMDEHAVVADVDDHDGHDHNGGHHAHACLTCASCCVGAALPAVSAVSASTDLTHFSVSMPADAGVALFLTGGIERPPRSILV
ncbi:hypothetical protein BCAR13_1140039 [Paraburkholderia caribensis]|nr:hypothetical protein BCAR13_1140039 [Paraburkholderia caribensis]